MDGHTSFPKIHAATLTRVHVATLTHNEAGPGVLSLSQAGSAGARTDRPDFFGRGHRGEGVYLHGPRRASWCDIWLKVSLIKHGSFVIKHGHALTRP